MNNNFALIEYVFCYYWLIQAMMLPSVRNV